MKRICVYCGSRPGRAVEYGEVARALGQTLAARGIGLVYGGASVGCMGSLADAVLEGGGDVVGVIPENLLKREVAHLGVANLEVVADMHERKARMSQLADSFIALPGGLGTLEELFEMLTWSQLGIHSKPCGLVNVGGYYDHLISFLDHALDQEFISLENRALLKVETDPVALLDLFLGGVE